MTTNPDPDPIRIQGFDDQKLKKNYSWNFFYNFFLSKTAIYLSLGLHKVCPSYRRSLQLSKEAIQHFKTWTFTNFFYFFGSFLPSWIRIHRPDWIRIQSRSGSATLVFYRCFEKKEDLHRVLSGLEDRVSVFISSVADPGCLSRIPLPESERYRFPDPDPQQKI